ncbi:hypothetical protein GCM10009628_00220 [Paeniglutamicibacter kerguelensis]
MAADLGNWRTTLRLNKEEDKKSRTNDVVGMIVGAIVTTASVLFLARWHPQALELWVVVLALGVVGLSLMAIFARDLVHKYRVGVRGMLLAHVYEMGLVFERTMGSLFTVPLNSAKIRYVAWDDDGEDERHREQLWVTLIDGTVRAVETWTEAERRQLSELASCLRLGGNPQVIEPTWSAGRPEAL